ncbi:MAG: pirin family protein [Cyanobium sp. LacPavin_0818_WC50_MAG_67_9]|nr:pirin family protein [Cyanobium sp. LacPavin_0818_WC50_MAG_67_9]
MTNQSAGAASVFRPAAERFHSQLDWLDSWHSFSFGGHHDPAWMGFGPLRVINDDTIAAGRGFGMHPHRDMEIITVMVDGQLNHHDSMGHSEVLRAGEVQHMSAGTGVVHSEMNGSEQACRLLQIWIEPSQVGLSPAYAQKPFSIGPGWTPLLDPEQRGGALAIQRPVRLWRAQPEAGQSLPLAITAGHQGWIQLISGGGQAAGRNLQQGDGLGFEAGALDHFTATSGGADLLLFELH